MFSVLVGLSRKNMVATIVVIIKYFKLKMHT